MLCEWVLWGHASLQLSEIPMEFLKGTTGCIGEGAM